MDAGLVIGICIIITVVGVVFWLPVIVFFPVIKSLAERISGKSTQVAQIQSLQQKVAMLEHELSDIKMRQISVEDAQKFSQQLLEAEKKKER
ncbi:MAG TPA: hypothetical protein V6C81_22700 [Planktothrix sp.]|jgi:hypothetical protein